MSEHPLIGEWRTYLRAGGFPDTTIRLRTRHIRRVACAYPDLCAVTTGDLVSYLAGQEWKPATRQTFRASLRAFYGWTAATGHTATNPAYALPVVRVPRNRPRPIPEPLYFAAVAATCRDCDRLALILTGVCGLRAGEVSRVHRDHFEETSDGLTLRVLGKGGNVRIVPVPDQARPYLPAGWLYPSPVNKGEHMRAPSVAEHLAELLPEGWSAHKLRHRAATRAYAATKDIRAVQELLGHQSPATTAIYTLIPDEDLRAAVSAIVPTGV
ncbi:tyrosine-type recombinase/integrase [Nocardioides sp.]|uniref:tyrosine-type recombinase/integrase n=1 Tax=Nocardioides sp. TaxID=35761 RepID=UPI0039E349C1